MPPAERTRNKPSPACSRSVLLRPVPLLPKRAGCCCYSCNGTSSSSSSPLPSRPFGPHHRTASYRPNRGIKRGPVMGTFLSPSPPPPPRRPRIWPGLTATDRPTASPAAPSRLLAAVKMATSKKEPLSTSRDRATRMSPNLRPSSSESSGYGYGARRARSVPSSPDRKFGSSSPSVAAVGSSDVNRPSLSSAGRSVSSRTMSTSGSSIHGSRAQVFPGSASKPMLARAKSDKVSTAPQRPPALAVPPSKSFKDMSKTVSKASPSSSVRNKLSPKPCADNCKAAQSPKPSSQRMPSQGAARGGRVQPVSTARSPGVAAKKRLDGATVSSKAKGASQKTAASSVSRMENEVDASMQFNETESLSTPSAEELLHEHLTDPVDLKSTDVAVPDQYEAFSNLPEQQVKDEEDVKGHFSEENVDVGGNDLHNGGKDANSGIKIVDEPGHTEEAAANGIVDKAVPLPNMTEAAQVWKKDDPKGNEAIEEAKRKLLEERKSRVKALVGAFETVLSFKE